MTPSKAKRAQVAERRKQAIALVLAGVDDWDTIARKLGYASRGAAHTDVTRALEASLKELAERADVLRHVEVQRLNRLQAAVWPKAMKGDTKSADTALRVVAQRCKLQGTEPPTTLALEHRLDVEAAVVADALAAALDALDLTEEQRKTAAAAAHQALLNAASEKPAS